MKTQIIKRYQLQVVEGKRSERVDEYATTKEALAKKEELEAKKATTLDYGSDAMKEHVKNLSWRVVDLLA